MITAEMDQEQKVQQESLKLANEVEVRIARYQKIETVEVYQEANLDLRDIKGRIAKVTELRFSVTRPLDEAKKRLMDIFAVPLNKLSSAEIFIKRGMLAFQQEQERVRRAEEDRQREIARKEEEKQRKILEEKAARAAAAGKAAKAEALREKKEQVFVPAPIVESQTPKLDGTITKKVWKYRIVDVSAIPREYMIPDEKKIGAMVRASKGTLRVDGVEIYSEEVLASSIG